MSNASTVRRADLMMEEADIHGLLERGYCARLATVGEDGRPYAVPLLYVLTDGRVYMHNSRAVGHLRQNLDHESSACLVIDEPGEVFGRVHVVEDDAEKRRFCDALMRKYADAVEGRPAGFFPRLDHISVYAMSMERVTGKHISLPAAAQRWPLADRTKSPGAMAP